MNLAASVEDHRLSRSEQALIDAALSLTQDLNVQATCTAMLVAVERIFEARSSWIMLHHEATQELVTATFRGPGSGVYSELRLPLGRGVVGLVYTTRDIVFVPDVHLETRWFNPARVQTSGLRSVLAVP